MCWLSISLLSINPKAKNVTRWHLKCPGFAVTNWPDVPPSMTRKYIDLWLSCSVTIKASIKPSTVEHLVQGDLSLCPWAMVTHIWIRISCFLFPLVCMDTSSDLNPPRLTNSSSWFLLGSKILLGHVPNGRQLLCPKPCSCQSGLGPLASFPLGDKRERMGRAP